MLIKDVEVMILKTEKKENKDKIPYIALSLAILEDGTVFDLITKDIKLLKLEPFSKHTVNLDLTNSKYGINLKINEIVQ